MELAGEQNPFVRYREQLDSYQQLVGAQAAVSDEQFVDAVSTLDAHVASVWGHGFRISPLIDGAALAAAVGIDATVSIKVEAGGVGGSHKARHLFGVAIASVLASEGTGSRRLAIASCGNAALGAAVVARALDRPLDVFVPMWADEVVVALLDELGATINRCERRDGEAGDPCYLRFREAVDEGAVAFGVQSDDTPATLDGARTLGWEIDEQVAAAGKSAVSALYVQVGGGALATSVSRGLPSARLYPVQAEGCAPLRRAWDRWTLGDYAMLNDPDAALMEPWDNPQSFATGILDDVTYDWRPLLERTHETGGHPIVAPESNIRLAYELAHRHTDVNVCSTGAAGLAGLLTEPLSAPEHVALLFTGVDRT